MRALLIALALAACAHEPAPAPRPAQAIEDEWKALDWNERHDVMTWTVLPNLARTFQRFEGKPSPDLTCRTCHGPDPEDVRYKMPRGLTALDPAHMPASRVATFMADEVVPQMRELMGAPSLSCFSCHPRTP
jgi:hypothetical protein